MVIQRIQTLFLLLAVILMALAMFVPAASLQGNPLYITDMPVVMIVDILVAVLLFIGIFMYKSLKTQMRLTLVSLLLICAVALGGGFYLWRTSPDADIEYFGAVLLMICAVLAALLAYRGMRHDYHLLRSADRLR